MTEGLKVEKKIDGINKNTWEFMEYEGEQYLVMNLGERKINPQAYKGKRLEVNFKDAGQRINSEQVRGF